MIEHLEINYKNIQLQNKKYKKEINNSILDQV